MSGKLMLPPMSQADALRFWLRNGQRVKASENARDMARNATPDGLREIIAALADGLDDIGDSYKGRRGAPKKLDPMNLTMKAIKEHHTKNDRLERAAVEFLALQECAALLRSGSATPKQGRDATATLKRHGIPLDRQFKTNARIAAARSYGVSDTDLKTYLRGK